MKKAKKLASLLLALVMVVSMGAMVFAEEVKGTITIDKPVENETYTAYKIFSVAYDTKVVDGNTVAGDHYTYTIAANDPWFEDVKSFCASTYDEAAKTFTEGTVTPDSKGVIKGNGLVMTPNADKTIYTVSYVSDQFKADVFAKYLNTKKAGKTGTTLAKKGDTVSATGLDLGYYLVDTTLGSLCSLDTTNPSVTIQEKNAAPTNVKKVQVTSTDWGEANDTTINKIVKFKSTITVPATTESLCFHDKMCEGLTFVKDAENPVGVSLEPVGASTSPITLVENVDFKVVQVVPDSCNGEKCTFHVEFMTPFFEKIGRGNYSAVITYSARLNEKAKIGTAEGNTNTSKVSYGENNNYTLDSTTTTYTYEVPVFKFAKNDNTEMPLSDTHFKLYTRTATDEYTKLIKLVEVNSGVTAGADDSQAVYRVATDKEIADAETDASIKIVEEIVTNNSGKFKIQGLARGTYKLEETAAHEGYNMLPSPVYITIQKNQTNGNIEILNEEDKISVDEIKIENKTGTELPSTGGIGTTIFYVVGSILLVGAAVLLITKKRMSAAE